MGLLDLLKLGSKYTKYDGQNPDKYQGDTGWETRVEAELAKSKLDLPAANVYSQGSNYQNQLAKSNLDLDGQTPSKYTDNLPK
jgi:hypothetical protein